MRPETLVDRVTVIQRQYAEEFCGYDESVSSLRDMASRKIRRMVASALRNETYTTDKPWELPRWIAFKKLLHGSLPVNAMMCLYKICFSIPFIPEIDVYLNGDKASAFKVVSRWKVNSLSRSIKFALERAPERIFLFWWLFFEDRILSDSRFALHHDVSKEFLTQQIYYFSNVPNNMLTTLNIEFDWILLEDFRTAIENLPSLTDITLKGQLCDQVFEVLSQAKLKVVKLVSPFQAHTFKYETFVSFLKNISRSLKVLDMGDREFCAILLDRMLKLASGQDDLLKVLKMCSKLEFLSTSPRILSLGLRVIQDENSEAMKLPQVSTLELHCFGRCLESSANWKARALCPNIEELHIFDVGITRSNESMLEQYADVVTELTGSLKHVNVFKVASVLKRARKIIVGVSGFDVFPLHRINEPLAIEELIVQSIDWVVSVPNLLNLMCFAPKLQYLTVRAADLVESQDYEPHFEELLKSEGWDNLEVFKARIISHPSLGNRVNQRVLLEGFIHIETCKYFDAHGLFEIDEDKRIWLADFCREKGRKLQIDLC